MPGVAAPPGGLLPVVCIHGENKLRVTHSCQYPARCLSAKRNNICSQPAGKSIKALVDTGARPHCLQVEQVSSLA